jgi:hypothetical protein
MPRDVRERVVYEIPSSAAGDEGIEGFSVQVGGERVGRVAALNRTPDGLVVVVDAGDAYRAVPAAALTAIETESRRVGLTADGEAAFAAAAAVDAEVRSGDSRLVRHIPRQFDRLVTPGERVASRRSSLWYAGGACVLVGGVAAMAGPLLTAEGIGGSLRWLWIAIPAAVCVVGAALLWTALGRDSRVRLSRRDKAADALSAVFGISPRTRRRG